MAVAELVEPQTASPGPTPIWWRQRHSYAFGGVVGLQISVGPFWVWIFEDLNSTGEPETVIGIVIAQCFLLGLWAALGGLRVLPRWGAVTAVYAVGLVAFIRSLPDLSPEEFLENLLMGGLLGMMIIIASAVCLLPLRSLAGWRVDFDAAYHRDARLRRGQVAFLDFAGYTCAVAAMLTVTRMMADTSGEGGAAEMAILASIVAFVAATASVPAYMVLKWKWLWLALVASGLWVAQMIQIHSWLGRAFTDLQFFGGGPLIGPTGIDLGLAAFHGAIGTTTIATLAILRFCGLKLLVVQPPPAGAG